MEERSKPALIGSNNRRRRRGIQTCQKKISKVAKLLEESSKDEYFQNKEDHQTFKLGGIFCTLCNIYVTARSELEAHEQGKQHRKKLGLKSMDSKRCTTIFASLSQKGNDHKTDYSLYRTPSGDFYCHICNLTITSEVALKQHLEGKKHLKNITSKLK